MAACDGYGALATAMILQAVRDCRSKDKDIRQDARKWYTTGAYTIWYDYAGLDLAMLPTSLPARSRQSILRRIARRD